MKKIVSFVIIFIIIFCFPPSISNAEENSIFTYTVSDNKVTITDCDLSVTGELIIPSTLGGYPVVSIGYLSLANLKNITTVIIPDSVTSIASHAFNNSHLEKIYIPGNVTNIGNYAFAGCRDLKEVYFGTGVKNIGQAAFLGCKSLTVVEMSDTVTTIDMCAFQGCSSLKYIRLSNNLKALNNSVFYQCTSLNSIYINKNASSIHGWAFSDCSSLKNVYYTGTHDELNSALNMFSSEFFGDTTIRHINYNCEMRGSKLDKLILSSENTDIIEHQILADFCYNDFEGTTNTTINVSNGITINELIETNKTDERMNSTLFSNIFFKRVDAYSLIGHWELLNVVDKNDSNGFVAMLFKNNDNYVIAFRGSENGLFSLLGEGGQDWKTDFTFAMFNELGSQFNDAVDYYLKSKKEIEKFNSNATITLTGHSLGGALVGYTSILTGARGYSFDGAVGHIVDLAYLMNPNVIDFTDTQNMNFTNYTDEGGQDFADFIQHVNPEYIYQNDYKTNENNYDAEYGAILMKIFGNHCPYSTLNANGFVFGLNEIDKTYRPKEKWRMDTNYFDALDILQTTDNAYLNLICSKFVRSNALLSFLKSAKRLAKKGTTILGTKEDDILSSGSFCEDRISYITKDLTNYSIYGGDGNDKIYGTNYADKLSGGKGNDVLYGGFGNDMYIVSVDETATITDFATNSIVLKGFSGDSLKVKSSEENGFFTFIVNDGDYYLNINNNHLFEKYELYNEDCSEVLGIITSNGEFISGSEQIAMLSLSEPLTKNTIIDGISDVSIFDEKGNVLGTYSNKFDCGTYNGDGYQVIAVNSSEENYIEIICKNNKSISITNNKTAKITISDFTDGQNVSKIYEIEELDTTEKACTIDLSNLCDLVYTTKIIDMDSSVEISNANDDITINAGDKITLSAKDSSGFEIHWMLDDNSKASIIDNEDGTCTITGILGGEIHAIAVSEQNGSFDSCTININDISISMQEGAQMRLNDVSGLRYLTNIDENALYAIKNAGATIEMGTLIAPEDLLNNQELTMNISEENRVDVVYSSEELYCTEKFTGIVGSIANIKESNTNRNFVGRGYLKITYNNTTKIIYADYYEGDISNVSRSIGWVSSQILIDLEYYNSLSQKHKDIINKYYNLYNESNRHL